MDYDLSIIAAARLARELPVRDARRFLHELLLLVGDAEEAGPLRDAYIRLNDGADRLCSIADQEVQR